MEDERPRRRRRAWIAIAGAVTGVLVIAGIAGSGDDPGTVTAAPTTSPAATPSASPSSSPTPAAMPTPTLTPTPAAGPPATTAPRLAEVPPATPKAAPMPKAKPKPVYYANCAAVRAAGKAPLDSDEPGYRSALDGDDDGVACEPALKRKSKPKPPPEPDPEPEDNDTDPRFGTCREAKSHGYGPYREGEDPEYDWYRDADNDGIVCE